MIYVLIMVATLHTNSYHVSELNTFGFKPMFDKSAKAMQLLHDEAAFVCIGRKIDVN